MKQVLQHRKEGTVAVAEVPPPQGRDGGILVRSAASLISAGTEKAGLELARKSMVGMARSRPDLVGRVLDKLQRDGFAATLGTVRDQLDREVPLGYSAAGCVTQVGRGASEFRVGDRVAVAGAGHASHAETNFVPRLLAATIPDGVPTETAAYTTVGAIALQGVRNADVRVGESVAVIGLGLIGQLACQILTASGARVVGIDLSPDRCRLAGESGVTATGPNEAATAVADLTRGRGVDAVLICAATSSNAPVELAARIARDRAQVVMVGVTGMDLPRADYYHKELTFTVSRSYGPGRYDAAYEEHGHDYPVGQVRWTQQRNLEAFLDLVAAGSVRPDGLTTHRFEIDRAEEAYAMILTGSEPHLGVLLTYPEAPADEPRRIAIPQTDATTGKRPDVATDRVGVSFLGAGNFARGTLLRHLAKLPVDHRGVVTSSGASAVSAGKRFGFEFCTAEPSELLADSVTDLVFVTTRHSRHASQVAEALKAGKAVFCEKPLAVSETQLQTVIAAADSNDRVLVGFNRRFAPLAADLKAHFAGDGPLAMTYRVNAGPMPHDHWLADPAEGGRIIGEACHFLDFASFLTDSQPTQVTAARLGDDVDNVLATVTFADGSVCQLTYATQGSMKASKERVEVHGGGRTAVLDDFRTLTLHGPGGSRKLGSRWKQDKGHAAELAAVVEAVRSGQPMPISLDSLVATTRATFAVVEAATTGQPVAVAGI